MWHVALKHHKTASRGKTRTLYFGPQAQAVLRPFLLKRPKGEYLFQPRDYLVEKHERAVHPRRPGAAQTERKSDKRIQDCYNKNSYRWAIAQACQKVGVPHWHPHQLRHTAATEFRKAYGVEAARAALGHSHVNATEIYAEVDAQIAERIAKERG